MSDCRETQALDPQAVLDRYAVCAEVMGRESDHRDPDGSGTHADCPQAAYSLAWFYRHLATPQKLNAISRAFLGDVAARRELTFGEADGAAFSDALLESRFPLNESQRQAIARALASDVSLIQGPPGTGKTEVILNLVSCILARGKNVAVVANNRKAIDNISTKIEAWRQDGERAGRNCQNLAKRYARLGGKRVRKAWVDEHPDDPVTIRFRTGDEEIDGEKPVRGLFSRFETGGWEPRVHAGDFLERYPFITSTIHSFKKCFADGDVFQFDYLIMDEASQCNPLLGLVAMSGARHVVLVGDVEQLPPIYSDSSNQAIEREIKAQGLTMIDDPRFALADGEHGGGTSIIVAVERSLADLPVPRTFLNEHYRCHPGIIGFCNEFVYAPGGNALEVKTIDYDGSIAVPIRIRWFEGNYCERCLLKKIEGGAQTDVWDIEPFAGEGYGAGKTAARDGADGRRKKAQYKLSRSNNRQIEIFMREEWPSLCERLERDDGLSACVLSPYRGALIALEHRLRLDGRVSDDDMGMEHIQDVDPTLPQIPSFTIHKSQGQEFDIVYLLPGEDGSWEWPWTEAKSLINVAVSRAKRELVIICSTALMSGETQAALVGERRVVAPAENMRDELSDGERARREERERFLQKLIDYVRDRNDPATTPGCAEGFPTSSYAFGFHRSRWRSVFDSVPLLRAEQRLPRSSAFEYAVENALHAAHLEKLGCGLAFEVPLSALVSCDDVERRWDALPKSERPAVSLERLERLRSGEHAHFDAVVFDRESGRLLLAIEVDGAQHRGPMDKADEGGLARALKDAAARRRNDEAKDALVRVLGGRVLSDNRREVLAGTNADAPAFTLLRLPTDGSTACEFDAFTDGADDAERFVTVEQLLEDHMRHEPDADPTHVVSVPKEVAEKDGGQRLPTLTSLIRRWAAAGDADAARFSDMKTVAANRVLAAAELLEGKPGRWRVTERGKGLGVVETRTWIEDEKKGASMRTVICYTAEAEPIVKRILIQAARKA